MACHQPPRDSTTLRQGSESFALFSRRQAFLCGGLPIWSAQNLLASPRQAICSCGEGPDCADAGRMVDASSSAAMTEIFMMGLVEGSLSGLKSSGADFSHSPSPGPCHVHG